MEEGACVCLGLLYCNPPPLQRKCLVFCSYFSSFEGGDDNGGNAHTHTVLACLNGAGQPLSSPHTVCVTLSSQKIDDVDHPAKMGRVPKQGLLSGQLFMRRFFSAAGDGVPTVIRSR